VWHLHDVVRLNDRGVIYYSVIKWREVSAESSVWPCWAGSET